MRDEGKTRYVRPDGPPSAAGMRDEGKTQQVRPDGPPSASGMRDEGKTQYVRPDGPPSATSRRSTAADRPLSLPDLISGDERPGTAACPPAGLRGVKLGILFSDVGREGHSSLLRRSEQCGLSSRPYRLGRHRDTGPTIVVKTRLQSQLLGGLMDPGLSSQGTVPPDRLRNRLALGFGHRTLHRLDPARAPRSGTRIVPPFSTRPETARIVLGGPPEWLLSMIPGQSKKKRT
jgi:hypothetical protein